MTTLSPPSVGGRRISCCSVASVFSTSVLDVTFSTPSTPFRHNSILIDRCLAQKLICNEVFFLTCWALPSPWRLDVQSLGSCPRRGSSSELDCLAASHMSINSIAVVIGARPERTRHWLRDGIPNRWIGTVTTSSLPCHRTVRYPSHATLNKITTPDVPFCARFWPVVIVILCWQSALTFGATGQAASCHVCSAPQARPPPNGARSVRASK